MVVTQSDGKGRGDGALFREDLLRLPWESQLLQKFWYLLGCQC